MAFIKLAAHSFVVPKLLPARQFKLNSTCASFLAKNLDFPTSDQIEALLKITTYSGGPDEQRATRIRTQASSR
jgi:hypothetical protein